MLFNDARTYFIQTLYTTGIKNNWGQNLQMLGMNEKLGGSIFGPFFQGTNFFLVHIAKNIKKKLQRVSIEKALETSAFMIFSSRDVGIFAHEVAGVDKRTAK